MDTKILHGQIMYSATITSQQGRRDLAKYKSSEWLLEKLATSWSFDFCKICPKCWNLEPDTKTKLGFFC